MRKKTAREARESALASGWTVEAEAPDEEDASDETAPDDDEAEAAEVETAGQTSNGMLVLLGVLGGLYLLYAWIWLSWAQYYASANAATASASGALGGAMQQVVFWAAPVAPILWFIAAMTLNRGRGARPLVVWLLLGAILLVPLPLFSGGGA